MPCGSASGAATALVTPRALGPFLEVAAALDIDVSEDRDGLVRAFVEHLRASGPTLIVVEDAHWADEATIDALAMLGRRVVDLPMLLVVTYRENEVTAEHPLRVVLGDLATSAGSAWLALRPLSLEAIRVLAVPEGASPEELYQRTGGNPFYVTEALAEPGMAVPTTVRLAVLARASRLTPLRRVPSSTRCRSFQAGPRRGSSTPSASRRRATSTSVSIVVCSSPMSGRLRSATRSLDWLSRPSSATGRRRELHGRIVGRADRHGRTSIRRGSRIMPTRAVTKPPLRATR